MERQLAAGMDLDALYGLSERELAGMEVEDDDDADADEDPVAAAGADAELDAPPGMRLDTLGGSDAAGEPGSSERLSSSGRGGDAAEDEAFTSSKEARSCQPPGFLNACGCLLMLRCVHACTSTPCPRGR